MFVCHGKKFKTLELAIAFARKEYKRTGVILGIEKL